MAEQPVPVVQTVLSPSAGPVNLSSFYFCTDHEFLSFSPAWLSQTCTFIFHIHSLSSCFFLMCLFLVLFPSLLAELSLSFLLPVFLYAAHSPSRLFPPPPLHSLLHRHCLFLIPSTPLCRSLALSFCLSLFSIIAGLMCVCATVFVSVSLPQHCNSSSFYLQLP